MLASRWLKSHEEEEKNEQEEEEDPHLFRRFTNAWEKGYQAVDNTYRHILAWALDHRPAVICLGLMIFVGSVATALPKPSFSMFAATLPFMGITVVILYLLWSLAARLQGWKRSLVSLLLLRFRCLFRFFCRAFRLC